jgi:hypothetical protein
MLVAVTKPKQAELARLLRKRLIGLEQQLPEFAPPARQTSGTHVRARRPLVVGIILGLIL